MEHVVKIVDGSFKPFPFPVGTLIRYKGEMLWELPSGSVLLKAGMEFTVNFVHDGWVGTFMEGYPGASELPTPPWATYGDSISNVCIYMKDTDEWELVVH